MKIGRFKFVWRFTRDDNGNTITAFDVLLLIGLLTSTVAGWVNIIRVFQR